MIDEEKLMREASTADPLQNQMIIIGLVCAVQKLKNTIDHLHADTRPDCPECGAQSMNLNLLTYEWDCSDCDY